MKINKPYWWHPEMKWLAIILLAYIIVLNYFFRFPNSNDFPGLALNCQLIDEHGWKYTINTNWGFAFPALHVLITEITDNLLVTQRLISGMFSFIAFILVSRISIENLKINPNRNFKIGMLLLVLSYYFIEMILSVHLDILPTTLVLFSLLMLPKKKLLPLFLASFMLGMAYWFRFHFLSFALVYPVLVFFIHRNEKRKWSAALITFLGVMLAVSIPHILTYIVYGQFSISNQKAVLDELINGYDWSCDHQIAIQKMSYEELYNNFNLFESIRTFWDKITRQTHIILIVIAAMTYFVLESKWAEGWRRLFHFSKKEAPTLLLVILYLIVCIFPFIYLRDAMTRLVAAFIIPVFPYFYKIVQTNFRVYSGYIIVILLSIYWHNASLATYNAKRHQHFTNLEEMVERHIPKSKLEKEPHRILATGEYFNPYHKYKLTYPRVIFAWGCRFQPFFDNYERIKLKELGDKQLKEQFDYIIFSHPPADSIFFFPKEKIYEQTEILEQGSEFQILKVK